MAPVILTENQMLGYNQYITIRGTTQYPRCIYPGYTIPFRDVSPILGLLPFDISRVAHILECVYLLLGNE
jgi:hypothetical protein